ncbi:MULTISPECIES: DUF6479 family protein [unclassified Streptomyces]|uniref:DUF6479 family protein n=1 Tax=unclassified Streptomyces TaxID=2593676 RepID=UPI002E2C4CCA|nr:DUF6479 family protein [Streptomyces sp. NBC_00223]
MSLYAHHAVQLAVTNDFLVGIGPLVIGLCIVGLLITAVWFGRRRSRHQPGPPEGTRPRSGAWQTRQEHDAGAPPDHGPGHQGKTPRSHESHEPQPEEVPRDGRRRLPHELHSSGVREGPFRTKPRRHSGPNTD